MSADRVEGPLTFATAEQWFGRVATLAQQERIDLGGVTLCDSAGAAFLLELRRTAQRKGRSLAFENAPGQLRELVTFFGLDPVLGLAA